jgi:putative oxidoreductase
MDVTRHETELVWPGLRGFYDTFSEIAYALMRVVVGYILLMHGWGKAHMGVTKVATDIMAKNGLQPALPLAYAATALETVGAVCIILGVFTRFVAPAIAIEIGIAFLFVHLPKGFAASQGGFEYVLLIGIVMLVVAIRGGGRYSVDRMIGREL